MKSPKVKGIGEVITEYGARVMKIFKKGLLGRSLFDFYGDVKADTLKTKESQTVPTTPLDGDGGVIYTKSADGKLYYKSNEVSEVELSSGGTNTTYSVSCVDGDNSDEEKIRLTGSDSSTDDVVLEAGTGLSIARSGDKITFTNTVTDTDTVLTTEQVQDIAGALIATGGTKTNIAVTYDDANNNMDFVVASDLNTTGTAGGLSSTLAVGSGGTGATSLTDNAVLTGTGSSAITAESTLSYDSETLTIGADDNGTATITRLTHSDDAGGRLSVEAGNATGTDKNGGGLNLSAGSGTGSGTGGNITFYSHAAGSSGSSAGSLVAVGQIDGSGNLQIDGDLTVSGNDIKDDDGTTCITFDSSGNTTIAGTLAVGDIDVTSVAGQSLTITAGIYDNPISIVGSDSKVYIRYQDDSTTGTNLIGMGAIGDDTYFRNDEGSFKFYIANDATVGAEINQSGDLTLTGKITSKQRQIYQQSFIDDLGTTKHYLPWKDINEQTTIYQEEVAMIAPYDGRIVSVTIRMSSVATSGNRTIGIHTIGPNGSQFSTGSWTEEETEQLAISSSDDNHVFYFVFDNAKHFESGELVVISIQDDTDLHSGSRYTYVSTVVEWDYNNGLGTGTSSGEFDSAQ